VQGATGMSKVKLPARPRRSNGIAQPPRHPAPSQARQPPLRSVNTRRQRSSASVQTERETSAAPLAALDFLLGRVLTS